MKGSQCYSVEYLFHEYELNMQFQHANPLCNTNIKTMIRMLNQKELSVVQKIVNHDQLFSHDQIIGLDISDVGLLPLRNPLFALIKWGL